MDAPIEFGDPDARNLELVRQIVLRRLKEDVHFQDIFTETGFEKHARYFPPAP
jgi:hypothetical protein